MVPKYRKQFASDHERSLITAQDSSISNALGEISAAESSVADHSQKCQDDVEQEFKS